MVQVYRPHIDSGGDGIVICILCFTAQNNVVRLPRLCCREIAYSVQNPNSALLLLHRQWRRRRGKNRILSVFWLFYSHREARRGESIIPSDNCAPAAGVRSRRVRTGTQNQKKQKKQYFQCYFSQQNVGILSHKKLLFFPDIILAAPNTLRALALNVAVAVVANGCRRKQPASQLVGWLAVW